LKARLFGLFLFKMEAKAKKLLEITKDKFMQNADTIQAFGMSKYMKYKFVYYGIKKPLRAKLQKEILEELGKPDFETIKSFSILAWEEPEREMQYFAMDLLNGSKNKLQNSDLGLIKFLIENKSWWDTVDSLAAHLAGTYFKLYPNQKELNIWVKSENFWYRRSAIIHQLTYKKETNEDMLFGFCILLRKEREFFIKKAIGWALRQYARIEPDKVINFVKNNDLSALSAKEALKNIEIHKQFLK
jgi:3-methyladenine DNA glycosylase AlkD